MSSTDALSLLHLPWLDPWKGTELGLEPIASKPTVCDSQGIIYIYFLKNTFLKNPHFLPDGWAGLLRQPV